MASLSRPRVLPSRKSSVELERENFEKFQLVSISKAINSIEHPVKEKHVRSAIIGTFQEKGALTFWSCVQRLPVQDNRIVAWKFCHVLHKLLREGHPLVIPQSQPHRKRIQDLGKLWCHLRESYGKLIQQYTQLLVVKLDFHRRNPRFPGSLTVTREELDAIGDNDINNYFQMAVEMFDYMDEILALQSAIFGSLDMSRSNSMTSCGQCRLAPLIPCIQDSSQLYDYCVRILFKLHAALPPDTLSGHRDRFLKQFKELSAFYVSASTLQYFRYLIQIPTLPENPPNFLIQSELLGYVAPVPVVVQPPEPEPSEVDSSDLIDTSDAGSMSGSLAGDLVDISVPSQAPVTPPDAQSRIIEHLRQEISRLHEEYRNNIEQLQDRMTDLETALATKDSELTQEKLLREDLLQQTDVADKYQEAEKRARVYEDKFHKLKEVYSKLRDEHIQLIRQKAGLEKDLKVCDQMALFAQAANSLIVSIKADVDKQLSGVRTAHDEAEKRKVEVEARLTELVADHDKVQFLSTKIECLESELQDVRLKSQKETQDGQLNLLVGCVKEAESVIEKSVHEVDNPAISAVTCTPDYLSTLVSPVRESVKTLVSTFLSFHGAEHRDWSALEHLLCKVAHTAHVTANYVLHAKATSNTSPDIELGEHMAEKCKELGGAVIALLANIRNPSGSDKVKNDEVIIGDKMDELARMVEKLTGQIKGDSAEIIGDMVEDELANMDKAIEEAANRIAEILSKSRAQDSGIKLEVNEKILDTCTSLMRAIRILVQKARLLQAEIVAMGKGSASAKEFYKRNHQWTEGLISAAKAVGMGAKFLLTAADKVVSGQGKLEALIVASQDVAASTAQLVVASRVKAARGSANLSALSEASRGVTQATGQVVATAKDCAQLIDECEEIDVSGLTLHHAKRLEMESLVKVLELEASLQQERLRLAALRRQHYQLAGDVEGWEIMDKP